MPIVEYALVSPIGVVDFLVVAGEVAERGGIRATASATARFTEWAIEGLSQGSMNSHSSHALRRV